MDPTDARAIVRELCRREGVELGKVLGRDRSLDVVRVRRVAVLELRRRGSSFRAIGAALSRNHSGVVRIFHRASLATSPLRLAR